MKSKITYEPGCYFRVENLGERFKIYLNPRQRAREWLTAGRNIGYNEFWAVPDISFELQRGFLGIMGLMEPVKVPY